MISVRTAIRSRTCSGHKKSRVSVTLSAKLNPICRYIQANALGVMQAALRDGEALVVTFSDERREEVSLPAAVKDFLIAFNAGAYPDLLLPSEAT